MDNLIAWAKENPEVAAAIVIYLLANVAPRPDHDKLTGCRKVLWQIIDRLCVFTSHKVPGGLKFLLLDSPVRGSDGEVEKAPKVPEKDDGDDGEDEDDKEEPAVVVDADEPDGDGAEEEEEGSDSDGKPE